MTSERKPTRRRFIQNATVLTVAASSMTGQHVFAGSERQEPKAEKLKLGVRPESSSPGPVVVETGNNVFLTFYGCKEDKRGNDMGDGTVMITLKGCRHWRLRRPGDEEVPSHSIVVDELDYCEVFEVTNSDWKPGETTTTDPRETQTARTEKSEDLKHYIVTFFGFNPELVGGGTHVECLATDIEADLFEDADFDALKKLMVASELSSGSDNESRASRPKIH